MVTVKLKLRQCVITLLYKTFTALSNELPLNNMQRASHPRGSLSFSSLNVQNCYLIVTLFLPCCLFLFTPPSSSSSSSPLSTLSPAAVFRSPVPSLLAFCISSSWLPSPGCVWRVCNSISCWWRSLRASTPAKSTTICADTASPRWWWASLRP